MAPDLTTREFTGECVHWWWGWVGGIAWVSALVSKGNIYIYISIHSTILKIDWRLLNLLPLYSIVYVHIRQASILFSNTGNYNQQIQYMMLVYLLIITFCIFLTSMCIGFVHMWQYTISFYHIYIVTSMAWFTTAVSPLLAQWRCCSFALSNRHHRWNNLGPVSI